MVVDSLPSAVYESAMKFTPLQKDVEQLVPVILARASYEKRQADSQIESMYNLRPPFQRHAEQLHHVTAEADERYLPVMQVLFDGMRLVRKGDAPFSLSLSSTSNAPKASKAGDPRLRLEKFFSQVVSAII